MTIFKYIFQSFRYFLKENITIALGVAITAAIITGSLIVGDSMQYSLGQTVHYRLGKITHAIDAGDRFFVKDLNHRLQQSSSANFSAVLKTEASGIASGGKYRINNIQVWGIDSAFGKVYGSEVPFDSLVDGRVIISENVAHRLALEKGDQFTIRMKKTSLVPLNTPFMSDAEQTVGQRVEVFKIAGDKSYGRLNLRKSQTAPFNLFLDINRLNEIMELDNRANAVLISKENKDSEDLQQLLNESWTIEDGNFHLHFIEQSREWEINSERIFIDNHVAENIKAAFPGARPILTYFVNEMSSASDTTPYSFVSSLPDSMLKSNEIVINEWLAEDLSAGKGDTLNLTYFEVGPLRDLVEASDIFIVKEIVPMMGRYDDESLMPFIPGLSDAGSCMEWDAGIPIDFQKVRDKDEDYWYDHKGTPKAFIAIDKALDLWQNRFGSYTAFRFNEADFDKNILRKKLEQQMKPQQLNIEVTDLLDAGLNAAQNGVDFSQLFMGLSFFILISGILLTSLLLIFNLQNRMPQAGTLKALGFSRSLLTKIYFYEGMIMAGLGSFFGILLALLYNKLVFNGLNQVWEDIVRTEVLETIIKPATLVVGFLIGIIVSAITIFFILRRRLKFSSTDLQRKTRDKILTKLYHHRRWLVWSLPSAFLIFFILLLFRGDLANPALFFIAGSILLLIILLIFFLLMPDENTTPGKGFNINHLMWSNLIRNKSRSMLVITLLSIGVFLVITTGANRKNLYNNAYNESSGTGGFLYLAESTIPILKNLGSPAVKSEYDLGDSINIVQFRVHEGDDASCLNLNRISNPRILATHPEELSRRFSFVTRTSDLDEENPWLSLNNEFNDVVPGIADQTVIKWGLGKKVGDTLTYLDAMGNHLKIKLIGGLAGSIFQGNVIIAQKHFLDHFPSSSGSQFFLIDGPPINQEEIQQQFNLAFRDFGWEMTSAVTKLAEFKSVENTYLTIFLVMGGFGLIIGTIGLAIVLARSILERRNEIAVLVATGFSRKTISNLLFKEYFVLLITGIIGGTISAIIATLPAWLNQTGNFSPGFVLLLMLVILVNGIIWIMMISKWQLKRLKILPALRND